MGHAWYPFPLLLTSDGRPVQKVIREFRATRPASWRNARPLWEEPPFVRCAAKRGRNYNKQGLSAKQFT